MELRNIPTVDLVNELRKREGVQSMDIEPYEEYRVETTQIEVDEIENTGPAVILIIMD